MRRMVDLNLPLEPEQVAGTYTIARPANAACRCRTMEKFACIELRLEPYCGSSHLAVDWLIDDAQIPECYLSAVVEGICDGALKGLAGECPVVNVRVSVVGGAYHDVDSSAVSYRIASRRAFETALREAGLARVSRREQ